MHSQSIIFGTYAYLFLLDFVSANAEGYRNHTET